MHLIAFFDLIKVYARGEKDRESNNEGGCPAQGQCIPDLCLMPYIKFSAERSRIEYSPFPR